MILKHMSFLQKGLLQRIVKAEVRHLSISKVLRKDHYEVLGVKRDATQAEIKNAYFELSKIYHPDRVAATDENLTKFREILAAYEILGNEQSRKLYDTGLIGKAGVQPVAPEGPEDPIIKFYKQRQQRSALSTAVEMDAWTEKFYVEARKSKLEKNELFQKSKKKVMEETYLEKHLVMIVITFICSILLSANLEGHTVERWIRKSL